MSMRFLLLRSAVSSALSRAAAGVLFRGGASSCAPATARRALSLVAPALAKAPVALPPLSYDYGELQPHLSPEVLEVHHAKHHQAYTNNLNAAWERHAAAAARGDLEGMLAVQGALAFNAGGFLNHAFYFDSLAPRARGGGAPPEGDLAALVDAEFGSLDAMIAAFNARAAAVQGSGYGWLAYDPVHDRVALATTPNQDLLEPATGLVPLVGVDVWEHAYYLQYRNVRPDYLKQIWNVVSWSKAAERLADAKKK